MSVRLIQRRPRGGGMEGSRTEGKNAAGGGGGIEAGDGLGEEGHRYGDGCFEVVSKEGNFCLGS